MDQVIQKRVDPVVLAQQIINSQRVTVEGLRAVDRAINNLGLITWLMDLQEKQTSSGGKAPQHLEEIVQLIKEKTFEIAFGQASVKFGHSDTVRVFSYVLGNAEMLLDIRDDIFGHERLPREWIMVERQAGRGVSAMVINLSEAKIESVGLDETARIDRPAAIMTMFGNKEVISTLARFKSWKGWSYESLLLVDHHDLSDQVKTLLQSGAEQTWSSLQSQAIVKSTSPLLITEHGIGFLRLATAVDFPVEELILVLGLRKP